MKKSEPGRVAISTETLRRKLRRRSPGGFLPRFGKHFAIGILVCALGWGFQEWVAGVGMIRTSSMEGSLLPGDLVVIQRSLKRPGSRVGGVLHRLGGGAIERGEIVVIERPYPPFLGAAAPGERASQSSDRSVLHLAKRVTAVAGDTVDVHGGRLTINGTPENEPDTVLDYWLLEGAALPKRSELYRMGVRDVRMVDGKMVAGPASHSEIAHLVMEGRVDRTVRLPFNGTRDGLERRSRASRGGRWHVPRKGVRLVPDTHLEAERLAWLIQAYEGREATVREDGKLCVDGVVSAGYAFGEDYVFVVGDNRPLSVDSRDWGPVPAAHVTGKIRRVLLSWNLPARALRTERVWQPPAGIQAE